MNNTFKSLLAGLCLFSLLGCAVTTPTSQDEARVRSAIEADPATPIDKLSRELGISELAVVKALPKARARQWIGGPEQAWQEVQRWPGAWVKSSTVAFLGSPTRVSIDPPENTPAFEGDLFIDLDWQEIEAVWLLRMPTDYGEEINELWWFNDSGEAVLLARIPGVGFQREASIELFEKMWTDPSGDALDTQ